MMMKLMVLVLSQRQILDRWSFNTRKQDTEGEEEKKSGGGGRGGERQGGRSVWDMSTKLMACLLEAGAVDWGSSCNPSWSSPNNAFDGGDDSPMLQNPAVGPMQGRRWRAACWQADSVDGSKFANLVDFRANRGWIGNGLVVAGWVSMSSNSWLGAGLVGLKIFVRPVPAVARTPQPPPPPGRPAHFCKPRGTSTAGRHPMRAEYPEAALWLVHQRVGHFWGDHFSPSEDATADAIYVKSLVSVTRVVAFAGQDMGMD